MTRAGCHRFSETTSLLVVVTAAGILSCSRAPTPPDDPPRARVVGQGIEFPSGSPQLSALKIEIASESSAASLPLTGRLTWDEDATTRVFPPFSGRILRVTAKPGERIRSNSILAEISAPDFGQAQSDASRSAADLAAAERARYRIASLFERGAAARKDLDGAETDLARARIEAQRTRGRLVRWGGSPMSAPDQIYRLTSPIGGVVVERNANVGQEVRPDATTPLFVVTDPSRQWVLLDVTERDLPSIGKGDRLSVRCMAYPDRTFTGRIDWIGDSLDPVTRTVRVRGSVRDPSLSLKAEMYVVVEDGGDRPHPMIAVPASAILTENGKSFCFVQEAPNRFRRVAVDIGPEREGRVPVRSGIARGSRVVTQGSLLLAAVAASGPGA